MLNWQIDNRLCASKSSLAKLLERLGLKPTCEIQMVDCGFYESVGSPLSCSDLCFSLCPRLPVLCVFYIPIVVWAQHRKKASSTSAGFSLECLPPCTSMRFTTQAHRSILITKRPIQCSALFNISLLAFFSRVHVGEWTSHCQQGILLVHLSIPPTACRQSREVGFLPWDHCLIKNITFHKLWMSFLDSVSS